MLAQTVLNECQFFSNHIEICFCAHNYFIILKNIYTQNRSWHIDKILFKQDYHRILRIAFNTLATFVEPVQSQRAILILLE